MTSYVLKWDFQARQESVSWPTLSVCKDNEGLSVLHTFLSSVATCSVLHLHIHITGHSSHLLHHCFTLEGQWPHLSLATGLSASTLVLWSPVLYIVAMVAPKNVFYLPLVNIFCVLSFLTESKSLLVGGLSTYLLPGLLQLPIFARKALPYIIQKWPTSWGA